MTWTTELKLSHKLVGLVLIPLACEIIFFGILTALLKETEQEAIKEAHAKLVIAKCNEIPDMIFNAGTSLIGFTMSRNEELGSKYFQVLDKISQDLRTIEILVHGNPRQQEAFLQVQEACASAMDIFETYRRQSGNRRSSSFEGSDAMKVQVQLTLDKIMTSIQALVAEERRISDVAPMTQAGLRDQILTALVAGIAGNIVIAILLTLLVNKDIVSRIGVMVDNTKRIVQHTALLPQVGGEDEISRLDGVFHDMAAELDRAARHKQELIAMVSHDLRSPLMSTDVSLQLVGSGALGAARVNEEIEAASRNVKRLIELINDLLDIEKMQAGRLEMHKSKEDLLAIADSAIDAVKGSASNKNVTIEKPLISTQIDADRQRLIQVLVNLLANAIKYSSDGGKVKIEVIDRPQEVQVNIHDDGPGIAADMKEKIFERFQQIPDAKDQAQDASQRAAKGSGLGLAICQAIIQGHGGRIGVESEEGHGSTFWFTLPR